MDPKKTEMELLELERRYWQAMKDNDVNTALALTDTSCLVAGASGVASIDRDAFAKMMQSATYKLDSFSLDGRPKVRFLGNDVALLAYKVHEELTVDGEHVTVDAADCSTWVKKNGRWVCAAHTESLLGDPYGRDRNGRPH